MGSARDYITSSVADSLLPSLRRSLEDVVYETLDHRQVPTRTDFKDLRDQLNALRGQLAGSTGGYKKLAEDVERIDERIDALDARLAALERAQASQSATLTEILARLEARPAPAPAVEPAAQQSPGAEAAEAPSEGADSRRHCKVPGCEEHPRSKGFCARHYQLWRRGRLEGFPNEDAA